MSKQRKETPLIERDADDIIGECDKQIAQVCMGLHRGFGAFDAMDVAGFIARRMPELWKAFGVALAENRVEEILDLSIDEFNRRLKAGTEKVQLEPGGPLKRVAPAKSKRPAKRPNRERS
ncbi:MAG: hypothetical protein ABSC08_17045 [Bryobacteraceae bacterium]|jgi:hypothetical protein